MTDQAPIPLSSSLGTASTFVPAHVKEDLRMRLQTIQGAVQVFRQYAFHDANFDLVAQASGLPLIQITRRFTTWEDLLEATITFWNGQRMRPIVPLAEKSGAAAFLRGIVQANIEDPALMRLLTATVNIAATPQHPLAPFLQQEYQQFHLTVSKQLAADIAAEREPATMEPSRGAEQLIALYEGLQLQSMVRPTMDLLEAYDRAVTRLRAGWARTYVAPIWDLDIA